MQIICNHCGNQLTFPDYQNLVTCNHCATHLQIEETERTYSVSIIEKQVFDDLLIQSGIIQSENEIPYLFVDLLELATEHTRTLEKTTFFSLLSWKKIEPVLLRVFYRFVIALGIGYYSYSSINWMPIYHEPIFNNSIITGFVITTFIFLLGLIELFNFVKKYQFNYQYKIQMNDVVRDLQIDLDNNNLNDSLKNWYAKWSEQEEEFRVKKDKFTHFRKLGIKIPIGIPSVSKGFRIFIIAIPTIFFALQQLAFSGFNMVSIILGLISFLSGYLGIHITKSGDKYQVTYESYQLKRKKRLKELEELIDNK